MSNENNEQPNMIGMGYRAHTSLRNWPSGVLAMEEAEMRRYVLGMQDGARVIELGISGMQYREGAIYRNADGDICILWDRRPDEEGQMGTSFTGGARRLSETKLASDLQPGDFIDINGPMRVESVHKDMEGNVSLCYRHSRRGSGQASCLSHHMHSMPAHVRVYLQPEPAPAETLADATPWQDRG